MKSNEELMEGFEALTHTLIDALNAAQDVPDRGALLILATIAGQILRPLPENERGPLFAYVMEQCARTAHLGFECGPIESPKGGTH